MPTWAGLWLGAVWGSGEGPGWPSSRTTWSAFLGGVRHGFTLGSPIAVRVGNSEWPKWQTVMSPEPVDPDAYAAANDVNAEKEIARNRPLTRPRPGHADLVGMQKYGFDDARPILERASARETAARVALGEVAARFLEQTVGIRLVSHTVAIGTAAVADTAALPHPDDVDRPTPTRSAPSTPVLPGYGRRGRGGPARR